MKNETTYWNFEETFARRVWVVVWDSGFFPLYWAKTEGIVGKRIEAVEVVYAGETFYLDDRDGTGWAKVTSGMGSPRYGHRDVDVEPGRVEAREEVAA